MLKTFWVTLYIGEAEAEALFTTETVKFLLLAVSVVAVVVRKHTADHVIQARITEMVSVAEWH